MTDFEEIKERLIRLEVHLENHLGHHKRVLLPMVIAIIILLLGLYLKKAV